MWLCTAALVASLFIGLFLSLSPSFSASYLCLFPKASTCFVDLQETLTTVLIQCIKLPMELITKSSHQGNMYSYLAHTSDIVNNCMLNEAIKFSRVSTRPFGFLSRKDNELTTRTHGYDQQRGEFAKGECIPSVLQCIFPKQKTPLSSHSASLPHGILH